MAGVVDICLIPEVNFNLDGQHGLMAYVQTLLADKGHCVICVAEGAGQVLPPSLLLLLLLLLRPSLLPLLLLLLMLLWMLLLLQSLLQVLMHSGLLLYCTP